VVEPDELIGSRARNLLDNDGIEPTYDKNGRLTNVNEGTMWLSNELANELVIDLKNEQNISKMYIWNYNEQVNYGLKSFNIYHSNDGENYTLIDTLNMNKASGNPLEPYTLEVLFEDINTRYLKIEVLESYDENFVGLGKILLL